MGASIIIWIKVSYFLTTSHFIKIINPHLICVMKTTRLSKILYWLKENKAHQEHGVISIPTALKEDIIELVGDNEIFKELLIKNQVHKNFLYQRIMINQEFAYNLAEEFWFEQFHLIQTQI